MKSHKYTVLSILAFILVLVLFFILRPYVYKIIPPKEVEINKEFSIRKWQTVTFGQDKYVTYCGTKGNAVSGTGPKPAYILRVNNVKYPCTTKSINYFYDSGNDFFSPFVVFLTPGNPATALIKNSNQAYNEWADSFLYNNCGVSNIGQQEKIGCLNGTYPGLVEIGDPSVCRRQNYIDKQTCINIYISKFKNMCTPQQSKPVNDSGTWTREIKNQDDCLVEEIISRHLPSENCQLLIKDKNKLEQCFKDRKAEEDYFEFLRN